MFVFKYILLAAFCFVSIQGISEELQEMMNMLHNQCRDETGTTDETISNALKRNFADDEALKCYMRCLLMQMTVMDDDGMVDTETMIAMLPDDFSDASKAALSKAVQSCGTKVGANACDNAYLTNLCWADVAKEHYFIF